MNIKLFLLSYRIVVLTCEEMRKSYVSLIQLNGRTFKYRLYRYSLHAVHTHFHLNIRYTRCETTLSGERRKKSLLREK